MVPGDSPRLNGEDKSHIARLAEIETELPPILVDRRTMKVVDGMHRLMAASMRGDQTIQVIFFDGSDVEAFLRAVEENVTHGLPLSQADRRAAAERIIGSHPQMSDREIARSTGLATKTVASLRKRLAGGAPQLNARVGKDGKVRPLDSGEGRRRAAQILAEQPTASLRDVAKIAGISPATVLDVRKRIRRGEPPVPTRDAGIASPRPGAEADDTSSKDSADSDTGPAGVTAPGSVSGRQPASVVTPPRRGERTSPAATVERLLRDPSLRNSEGGRWMLRLLQLTAVGSDQLPTLSATVPPHCVLTVAQLARQNAEMWRDFEADLKRRARVIDPAGRY